MARHFRLRRAIQTADQLAASITLFAPPNRRASRRLRPACSASSNAASFSRSRSAICSAVSTSPTRRWRCRGSPTNVSAEQLAATAAILGGPIDPPSQRLLRACDGQAGASELNLSSDIDLIYLLGGRSADPTRLDAAQRFGETLTEILSAECFRVDMRLRPGGRNAPLVVTTEGALTFYENLGDTWERAALLRARPVAGAIAIGRAA